jgi:predicted nuclease of restriction endonuclease-like RecB superfamily
VDLRYNGAVQPSPEEVGKGMYDDVDKEERMKEFREMAHNQHKVYM